MYTKWSTRYKKNRFITVLFSHLDVNQHMNYGRYIQWIMDSYPPEIHLNDQLESLEINFLAEAELNDGIAVQTKKMPVAKRMKNAVCVSYKPKKYQEQRTNSCIV